MSDPTTEAGRAASKLVKSGMLGLWADDPDPNPIDAVIAGVERAGAAAVLAELRTKVEALEPYWAVKEPWDSFHRAMLDKDKVLALLSEDVS